MDKYRVPLTVEERAALELLVSRGVVAARKITHARILLLADTDADDLPDQEIAAALKVSLRTVSRVRQAFVTQGIDASIDRKPQPPRPHKIKIKGDLEQRSTSTDPLEFHLGRRSPQTPQALPVK